MVRSAVNNGRWGFFPATANDTDGPRNQSWPPLGLSRGVWRAIRIFSARAITASFIVYVVVCGWVCAWVGFCRKAGAATRPSLALITPIIKRDVP